MKILIAEDEAVSRLVLSTMLARLEHDIVIAQNGREAWTLYRSEHPSVIITDWMMPELDGLELTRMIRAERRIPYPYVMILTTLTGKGSMLEGLGAGADDFITKPFDFDTLEARLNVAQRILSVHGENDELKGHLQICNHCRKIRYGDAEWLTPEAYIAVKARSSFLTSLCPECLKSGAGHTHEADHQKSNLAE
jgi:DNA-binding response OmpR family regulator